MWWLRIALFLSLEFSNGPVPLGVSWSECKPHDKMCLYVFKARISLDLTKISLQVLNYNCLYLCWHSNRNYLKFCLLYTIVPGNPNMSGFSRKIPKGTHLLLSTGLPGISPSWTSRLLCSECFFPADLALLFHTSPDANSLLALC